MQYGTSEFRDFNTFRNVVINGDNQIAQIGDGFGFPVNTAITFPAVVNSSDMWWIKSRGAPTAIVTDLQTSDHPLLGNVGFCKNITVTANQPVIPAADNVKIGISVEGYLFSTIWKQHTILSFWVKSPKIGTHYGSIVNDNADRSFVFPYTINAINTWEYKQIAIDFSNENAANYFFNDTPGIHIHFSLAVGANFITPNINAFVNGLFYAGPNPLNLLDTNGNSFRVTDVQLEAGFVATAYDRIAFDENLQRCQRYSQSTFDYGIRPQQNIGIPIGFQNSFYSYIAEVGGVFTKGISYIFPTELRILPTPTFYNPKGLNDKWYNISNAVDSGQATYIYLSSKNMFFKNTQLVGDLQGHRFGVHFSLDANLLPSF